MIEQEKFLRRANGDDAARFEQSDARREKERFAEVVSDEEDGLAKTAREGAEFTLQFGAGDGVQCTKRFVHKKDWRVSSEGARNADALALAAGKLTRAARGEFGRVEADEAQQLFDASGDARGVPVFEGRNKADIFGDREMREKSGLLNDVADAATQADGVPGGSGATLHKHLACRGKEQSIDEPEEGGLATAAAAEKNKHFGRANSEGNIGDQSGAVHEGHAVGDATKFD